MFSSGVANGCSTQDECSGDEDCGDHMLCYNDQNGIRPGGILGGGLTRWCSYGECQPLNDSTCPGDDNYCEIKGKCVSYSYRYGRKCSGYRFGKHGIYAHSFEGAISKCNQVENCKCFEKFDGFVGFELKGFGTDSSNGFEAWVKT